MPCHPRTDHALGRVLFSDHEEKNATKGEESGGGAGSRTRPPEIA